MFEIFHLLGTRMYIYYGCDSSNHLQRNHHDSTYSGCCAALYYHVWPSAVDCGVTVTTILKFNKRLKVMDEMAAKIHKLSDEIGENIYENVTTAVEKSEEFQETHEKLLTKISDTKENLMDLPSTAKEKIASTAASAREKLSESAENINVKEKIATYKETREAARLEKQREKEELERRYKELFAEKNFGFKRLMKAFPDMTSREQNESLQKYKKYFNIRRNKNDQNS